MVLTIKVMGPPCVLNLEPPLPTGGLSKNYVSFTDLVMVGPGRLIIGPGKSLVGCRP